MIVRGMHDVEGEVADGRGDWIEKADQEVW